MLKVVFFTHTEWSLGRFYIELTKRLWQYGIDCHILDWGKKYTKEEIKEQDTMTDFWISNPNAINTLNSYYEIPLEKCIASIYHTIDIDNILKCNLNLNKLFKLITISPWLQSKCLEKLSRLPELARFGINTNTYKGKLPKELKTVGFGSIFLTRQETQQWINNGQLEPRAFKRGYLVKEICEELKLELKIANTYHTTFMSMPGFYNNVDCVICSSQDEGAGGPVLEGGAAGRLIITTKTGDYENFITSKGADGVRVTEKEFKKDVIKLLHHYINDKESFQKRCEEIQKYSLENYDLDQYINQWIDLFTI